MESLASGSGVAEVADSAAGGLAPTGGGFSAISPVLTCRGMKLRQTHALAALLVSLSITVQADETFRCGQWIVSSELTVEDLVKKCGPPTSQESKVQDILVRNQFGLMIKNGETVTETWTYHRGTRAAPMVVTIIDGRIRSIERKK
jgi:hypothetical protein